MNAAIALDVSETVDRRKFVGGSDIAALLGIAPPTWRRNTPLALYQDKIEPPKEDNQNRREKRRGKRWEAVVGEMLTDRLIEEGHSVEVVRANERYQDATFPHFACEIDFEVRLDGEETITNVELKTVHPFKAKEWGDEGTDAAPVWYTAQAMWGLGITGRSRCLIAPLFGADEIRVYPIERADDVLAEIRTTADRFWREHVLARVPPPPQGLVDLAKLFPKDIGTTLECTDECVIDAVFELRAAGDLIDQGNARWNAAEAIVKEAMGTHATLTIGGAKAASWKHQVSRCVDVTALKFDQPEIYQRYLKASESRVFRLAPSKEK